MASIVDQKFADAFNHAMLYEVGPFWNPNDPDVIAGKIATKEQRKKVGYVNIAADRGGETKYGIAQKMNPDVNVAALDLFQAQQVYFNNYWLKGSCDKMPFPLSIMHFDGCVNIGFSRASKFLQEAVGAAPDGKIGNVTLGLISSADQKQIAQKVTALRTEFYKNIVKRDASQSVFLKGWLTRINEVSAYTFLKL